MRTQREGPYYCKEQPFHLQNAPPMFIHSSLSSADVLKGQKKKIYVCFDDKKLLSVEHDTTAFQAQI